MRCINIIIWCRATFWGCREKIRRIRGFYSDAAVQNSWMSPRISPKCFCLLSLSCILWGAEEKTWKIKNKSPLSGRWINFAPLGSRCNSWRCIQWPLLTQFGDVKNNSANQTVGPKLKRSEAAGVAVRRRNQTPSTVSQLCRNTNIEPSAAVRVNNVALNAPHRSSRMLLCSAFTPERKRSCAEDMDTESRWVFKCARAKKQTHKRLWRLETIGNTPLYLFPRVREQNQEQLGPQAHSSVHFSHKLSLRLDRSQLYYWVRLTWQ